MKTMATVKEEKARRSMNDQPSASTDGEEQELLVETPSSRKRHSKSMVPTDDPATSASRRSKRQRVAPKQYDEVVAKSKTPKYTGGKATWKEAELEKLLNCLKRYVGFDYIQTNKMALL